MDKKKIKKELPLLFLAVLFLAYCGEGLQNSVLGAVWPVAYTDLGVALSVVGYAQMVKTIGKMTGSFCTSWLERKWGVFLVTAAGLGLMMLALLGYAVSGSFLMLCICSIPMGFGDGLFTSALNAFAALHMKGKHNNWLNMFWSMGNALGPYIMSYCMLRGLSWKNGFGVLGLLVLGILAAFLLSWKYWGKFKVQAPAAVPAEKPSGVKAYRLKYMPVMFLIMFCYIAVENLSAVWGSSYILVQKGLSEEIATMGTTALFLGMALGRFLAGFIADKLGDRNTMFLGQFFMAAGGLSLAVSSGETAVLISAAVLGLGCAPIFPCFMHCLPEVFGSENTGAAVSLIIGLAQLISMVLPVVFGWIADWGGMWTYPYLLALFSLLMTVLLYCQKRHMAAAVQY